MYVDSDLKCKLVEGTTTARDDLMEYLTVEIEIEKEKNTVVTCVYRTPGSNIDAFIDNLEEVVERLNERKPCYLLGF